MHPRWGWSGGQHIATLRNRCALHAAVSEPGHDRPHPSPPSAHSLCRPQPCRCGRAAVRVLVAHEPPGFHCCHGCTHTCPSTPCCSTGRARYTPQGGPGTLRRPRRAQRAVLGHRAPLPFHPARCDRDHRCRRHHLDAPHRRHHPALSAAPWAQPSVRAGAPCPTVWAWTSTCIDFNASATWWLRCGGCCPTATCCGMTRRSRLLNVTA